jgi:hypothetical protein
MTDPSASGTRCPQAGTPEPGCPPDAGATVARTLAVRATAPPWCPPGGWPSPRAAPSWPGGRRPAPTRGSGPGVKPPRAGRT